MVLYFTEIDDREMALSTTKLKITASQSFPCTVKMGMQ